MKIFNQTFSTGEVVQATGVTNPALQSWFARKLIVGHRDGGEIQGGGSPGRHRRFSFFNLMEIAIVRALVDNGYENLERNFYAASIFSHSGDGATENYPERLPGLLFNPFSGKDGTTYLAVSKTRCDVIFHQIGKDSLTLLRSDFRETAAFMVLEIDEIFFRVLGRLDYQPMEVLEEAYRDGK